MNKRILKRHKRQVARAKGQAKVSEPDVRTPEQVKAAREASHPVSRGTSSSANYSTPSIRKQEGPGTYGTAKGDT